MKPVELKAVLKGVGFAAAGALCLTVVAGLSGVFSAPEWASPWAWLLLIPVLLLPLQGFATGINRLAVPTSSGVKHRWTLRRLLAGVPNVLMFVALGLMVLALARPQEVKRQVIRSSDGLDIMLAIDTSCSMEAEDLNAGLRKVSRLGVAKGVVADFVEGRPYDRIGIVVFGEEAFTHVPLTLDHGTLQSVLDQVQIGIAGQGTAIGSAIAVAARRLRQIDNPSRIMILLTDGENNAGVLQPVAAATAAAAFDIRIYTIGIGKSRPLSVSSVFAGSDGLDEVTLKAIAQKTQGEYFRATSAGSLESIFETIDTLETSRAEVSERANATEWYRWVLLPAAVFLLLQLVLGSTWLRRWP